MSDLGHASRAGSQAPAWPGPPPHYTNLLHHGGVAALASYPLGERLLVAAGCGDGRVEMWSLPENLAEGRFNMPVPVAGMAIADLDGWPLAVILNVDGMVAIWDGVTDGCHVLGWHSGSGYAVAVGRIGGHPVAASGGGDGMVRLWDLRAAAPLGDPVNVGLGQVLALAAGGAQSFVAGGAAGLGVVDLSHPAKADVRQLPGNDAVTSVAATSLAGEPIVVYGTEKGMLRRQRLADGRLLRPQTAVPALCLAPVQVGGRPMVAAGDGTGTIRLVDAGSGRPAGEFTVHQAPLRSLMAGELGKDTVLLSGDGGGRVVAWHLGPGAELAGPFARRYELDLPDPWPIRRDRPSGLAPLHEQRQSLPPAYEVNLASGLPMPMAGPPLRAEAPEEAPPWGEAMAEPPPRGEALEEAPPRGEALALEEVPHEGEAMAPPPRTGRVDSGKPGARMPPSRRLIAQIRAGGKGVRHVLAPEYEHQVIVSIAVPKRGELFDPAAFPEHEIPSGSGWETLTVEVTDEVTGRSQAAEIGLPTFDRSQPSSPAVFTITTGSEGSIVRLAIVVLFRGRPIQKARLFAVVRKAPVPGDAIRIVPVPLSCHPEPRAETTAADVTLELQGHTLRRLGPSGGSVDLLDLERILAEIEQVASRCYTTAAAPPSLRSETGRELLICLARRGHQLGESLESLGLGDAGTIAMLVEEGTPILPLELVYTGPMPSQHAKVCTRQPGPSGTCGHASAMRVCPWAFWGVRRVIARTFAHDPGNRPRQPVPRPLDLLPVLYAAANRADREPGNNGPPAAGAEPPSDQLQHTLAELMGAAQVTRVTSWTAWRRAMSHHPQLLVVLGHTQMADGEITLEIGEHSSLAAPDLNASFLGDGPPPLVLLIACATGVSFDPFGGFPAAFTQHGAAAVVATLSSIRGPDGASAATELVRALRAGAGAEGTPLGAALTAARRTLLAEDWLVGLLLVAHGEIDTLLRR